VLRRERKDESAQRDVRANSAAPARNEGSSKPDCDFTKVSQDSNKFPAALALSLWVRQEENLHAQRAVQNKPETQPFRSRVIVAYVVIITIVIDIAFLKSAASARNWIGTAVTVFSAALIIAGTLFTAMEMFTLAGRV
jgi:hypothetical protein